MKSLLLTLALSLLSTLSFGQDLKKQLINDDLKQIFLNADSSYGKIPNETIEKFLSDKSNLYYFELEYDGKLLFREAIMKNTPQGKDSALMVNMYRLKYQNILFDASIIPDSEKLKLLKSYKIKLVDLGDKEFVKISNWEIISKDYSKGGYKINNPSENIKINVYKITF